MALASRSAPKVVGIIGAAIAGPTLGLQLLSHPLLASRFKVVIFDKSSAPQQTPESSSSSEGGTTLPSAGAAVALFSNGLYPLYNLNLREPLDAASGALETLTIWRTSYGSQSPDRSIDVGKFKQLNSVTNPTWSHELQSHARAIERQRLQRLLVSEYCARGGELQWGKTAASFSRLDSGQIKVGFADASEAVVDVLVGADGGFSSTRKFILNQRSPTTADERWLPDFLGMTGFYGISNPSEALAASRADAETKAATHAMWLDDGILSVAPLLEGRMRWDLICSEKTPPDPAGPVEPSVAPASDDVPWKAVIMPGMYPRASTVDILRKHAGIYHPAVGHFGVLLNSAERIIRSPLRQRVWKKDEIQCGNAVLIGDAARLMLPSSGQGTGFAVEDATVLASMLLKYACTPDGDLDGSGMLKALEAYATQRVPRSKKMAFVASSAGYLSLAQRWYWRLLRDWGSAITVGVDMKKRTGKEPWPSDERLKLE